MAQGPFVGKVLGANERLGIGFIGCGGRSGAHFQALHWLKTQGKEPIEIVAACDVYRPRLKQRIDGYGGKAYMDLSRAAGRPGRGRGLHRYAGPSAWLSGHRCAQGRQACLLREACHPLAAVRADQGTDPRRPRVEVRHAAWHAGDVGHRLAPDAKARRGRPDRQADPRRVRLFPRRRLGRAGHADRRSERQARRRT